MRCDEARQLWHDACDTWTANAQLDGHIRGCEACRRYAAELRHVVDVLGNLREATEQQPFAPQPVVRASRLVRVLPALRVAAALALLAGGAIYFGRGDPGVSADDPLPIVSSTETAHVVADVRMALRGESADSYVTLRQPGAAGEPVQVIWLYATAGPTR